MSDDLDLSGGIEDSRALVDHRISGLRCTDCPRVYQVTPSNSMRAMRAASAEFRAHLLTVHGKSPKQKPLKGHTYWRKDRFGSNPAPT